MLLALIGNLAVARIRRHADTISRTVDQSARVSATSQTSPSRDSGAAVAYLAHVSSKFSADSSLIFQAAKVAAAGARTEPRDDGGAQRGTVLVDELAWISGAPEVGAALTAALFPVGVPLDGTFYSRLGQLGYLLGFTGPIEAITTAAWLATLRTLGTADQQSVLRAFAKTGHEFFQIHQGLSAVVTQIPLAPEFAAEWFPALLTRLGNDGATFEKYCEVAPANALTALEMCEAVPDSEVQSMLVERMVGTLRTVELVEADQRRFAAVEERLEKNPDPSRRELFLRSWIHTAHRRSIAWDVLAPLLAESSSTKLDDRFAVLCKIIVAPKTSDECFASAMEWLRQHASPELAPSAKHVLVEAAIAIANQSRGTPAVVKSLWQLLLAVQPIAPEHTGTWSQLEHFLVGVMSGDAVAFEEMLRALCKRSAGALVWLIRSGKGLDYLVSRMAARKWDDLVARMIFSSGVVSCQIALHFFERLGISAFPATILAAVDERELRLAFFAYQAAPLYGEVIARFLLAILPRVELASPEVQQEFADELLLQCKNYPSACLDALKRSGSTSPLKTEAIAKAEAYFAAIRATLASPLNSMMVPALSFVASSKRRATEREIREGAERGSIFAQLVTKVEILYGDSFCSFDGGRLTDSTPMQERGFEVEFPRIEEIDAEAMAMRRWHALEIFRELEKQPPAN